jgi:hypothetical protein
MTAEFAKASFKNSVILSGADLVSATPKDL